MSERPRLSTFHGTMQVVRFNWPKYAGVVVALGLWGPAVHRGLPVLLAVVAAIVVGLGAVWAVTSVIASWWVYDRRQVYAEVACDLGEVGRWASVHAGFDEATERIEGATGRAPVDVVEIGAAGSPSLRRARSGSGRARDGATARRLPMPSASLDTVFVTFAAHEVRDVDDQRALFGELHRSLGRGGRLVVTEHLRDLANALVYGPGALHFQRAVVWTDRAAEAGFVLERDTAITPFVHRMVWRR
jgi:hypothetical protein